MSAAHVGVTLKNDAEKARGVKGFSYRVEEAGKSDNP
jgi:hypothetical protein